MIINEKNATGKLEDILGDVKYLSKSKMGFITVLVIQTEEEAKQLKDKLEAQ